MDKRTTHIAYLVVCWNNRKIIDECLQSIMDQVGVKVTVHVIDNASADGSAEYIEKSYPDVKLIKSDKNNGFAKGNNILIKEALVDENVDYVALINSDAVIDKDWSIELMKGLEGKHRVACAQGTTLDHYNHQVIDSQHIYVGDNFQSVQYGYTELYDENYVYVRQVFGVNAAAAIYSRSFIEEQRDTVLFDEKFYMYLEDVDVAFRSIMAGWKNYYVPTAKAHHMGSVSSKKRSNGYNIQMTFRNQAALLFKNMPAKVFFANLPKALRFELHFYRHLKRTEGSGITKKAMAGRFIGLVRLPLYLGDRWRFSKKRKIDNATLERVMKNNGIFG